MAKPIDVPKGRLFLGGSLEEGVDSPLFIKTSNLTTHGVIVGMTGSGKTGLGIVLLEEILLSGRPALILDPKGDMGNLLLTFPELDGGSFQPWMEDSGSKAAAEKTAGFWKEGLSSWGITGKRIQQLRDKVEFGLYTPGSKSGVPLNIVGSLRAPKTSEDLESLRDEIEGFVSSLLALIGIEGDPISNREHILLSNLIEHAWNKGQDLDLAKLLGQIQDPPIRKLGVIDIDSFFPPKDRVAFALKINGLLASPAFGTWMEGPPLDIDKMLYTEDGKPRAAIVSMAHLSDAERQFVVTLVLSKLITWMRAQPGTDDLRTLVYMDEVFGFVPPTQKPPSKKPILTILKQARAFGVGLVLSTQNPVDIDYKALSNTGTWMIGRLQTERDKARLMDGLTSASGDSDIKEIERMISGLGKRQFMYHSTKSSSPQVFSTRWAMSYLKGPLTRDEIKSLTKDAPERDLKLTNADSSTPTPVATDSSSTVAPTIHANVSSFYLHPAAEWDAVDAIDSGSKKFAAAIAARVNLIFDDTKAKLKHEEEWETVIYPLSENISLDDAVTVDYDKRDMVTKEPDGILYELPDAPVHTATYFKKVSTEIKGHLYRNRSVTVFRNVGLKLYSRVGESRADFETRCRKEADKAEDVAADKLRTTYEARIKRARDMLDRAEDRLEELEVDHSSRKTEELLSGIGTVMTMFLGGKKSSRSIATELRRVSSRRKQTRKTSQKISTATNRIDERLAQLEDLENELADKLLFLDEEWDTKAANIEELEVGLEKTDIQLDELSLVWIPIKD